MQNTQFHSWGLTENLLKAIEKAGYQEPTPVQAACIPQLLEKDTDIVALAKTGTGKTAAFGIPLIQKLKKGEGLQALVLSPTRELASQTAASLQQLSAFEGLRVATVVGGVSYLKQQQALRANPEIIVSTPGRLIDLLEQGLVKLQEIRFLILDEADEMLSIGFKEALDEILSGTAEEGVQRWMFSATMSPGVRKVASQYLNDPLQIQIESTSSPATIQNLACVVFEEDKNQVLELLLQNEPQFYGIIFASTKKQVADLELRLRAMGFSVESLHGDKVQADRARIFDRLKTKKTKILVATDVAARGLDVQGLTHVVNYELPWDVETYTHRIGRTGRAGLSGTAWTLVKPKEVHQLRKFEKTLNSQFVELKVPTGEDIAFNKTKLWLEQLLDMPEDRKDFKHDIFQEVLMKLKLERELTIDAQAEDFLFKALMSAGIQKNITWKKPRVMSLNERLSKPGGGGFSKSRSFSSEGRGGFGRGRSSDRRDRGGYRGDREDRDSRPARDNGGGEERRSFFRSSRRDEEGSFSQDRDSRRPRGDGAGRSFDRGSDDRPARGNRERSGGGDRGFRSESSDRPSRGFSGRGSSGGKGRSQSRSY